jgi:ketosteroid isomerase-like protein
MKLKSTFVVSVVLVALASQAIAKSAAKGSKTGVPDQAYLQKIWDGWSTLNPDNVAQFYAPGPHTFFDIAPLKYNSWQEYEAGVRKVLADYSSGKCTVNDDADLHPAGKFVWGSATVDCELTHKDGKVDKDVMRWTVVFEKQGGKWLTVHEHVSMPVQ